MERLRRRRSISRFNITMCKKHKGKHDKPKPWDEDPNIDHWKIEKFDPSRNESGKFLLHPFPSVPGRLQFFNTEKYMQEAWPMVKNALKEYRVSCELNLVEGSMMYPCTSGMNSALRHASDSLREQASYSTRYFLAVGISILPAIKILNDEMQCDVIKIGNLMRSKERFVKRRERLLGPNLSTLKAIEILTGCYILVQGNTVAAMSSFKGLKQVRRVVEDCIHNQLHPVYHIKTLLMKREPAKSPALANENWDRFLPKFKKYVDSTFLLHNVKQRKVKVKEKKPYTPFPPPQPPSKEPSQISDSNKSEKDKNDLIAMTNSLKYGHGGSYLAAWICSGIIAYVMFSCNGVRNTKDDYEITILWELVTKGEILIPCRGMRTMDLACNFDALKDVKNKAKGLKMHKAHDAVKADSFIARAETSRSKKSKSSSA
ncbi:hypothetical protein ZIOFF_037359 [Zingiber officinale]|uniref:KRR1 small subunit processome component second KH domain-containing protein n=1 Tax=Zingiber officinale TaxID=94328 RepID=A0A8J5GD54_ZINOF|nr:hypothetical protein ZIOFF_037359 [Zingiber officinale]